MNRKNLSWILRSALAIILFAGILLSAMSRLQTGLGFGRDVKIILRTDSIDQVELFLQSSPGKNREWNQTYLGASSYMLEVSGVENIEEFVVDIKEVNDDIEILQIGSFGSVSKRISNESFLSIYLFTFMGVVAAFFTYRYRLMGLLTAFQILSSMVVSLFIVFIMGSPFTQTMWYTFNLVFMIYAFHKQIFLSGSEDMDPNDFFTKSWFLKHHIIVYLGIVIMSGLMLGFVDFRYTINGVYTLMTLVIMFLFDWLFMHRGVQMVEAIQDLLPEFSLLKETHFFGKPTRPSRSAVNYAALISVGVMLLSMITAQFQTRIQRGTDFSKQTILMVEYPTSSVYLEIQAILISLGMFDAQTGYDVSDQGMIWISFDETVSKQDLELASALINVRMKVPSSFIQSAQEQFPLKNIEFYLVYGVVTLLLAFLIQLIFERRVMGPIIIHSGFALLTFMLLGMMFNLSWNRESIYMLWSLPVLLSVSYVTRQRLDVLTGRKDFAMDSINTLIISISIAGMIGGVLVIVVPMMMASLLSIHVLIVLGSVYFGSLLMHATMHLIERVRISHDDVTS